MKKWLIALLVVFLGVLGVLGFYVAWPGWTGYEVARAIKARDVATLERKISFPDVRESLKPAAIEKIGEAYESLKAQTGPAGAAIVAQIKADVVPKVAGAALAHLVTAPNLIRVVNDGGSLKQNAERILQEQVGKIGLPGLRGAARAGGEAGASRLQLPGALGQLAGKIGLDPKQVGIDSGPAAGSGEPASPATEPPQTASSPPPDAAAAPPRFGLANIKGVRLLGPLALAVGVAKNAAATDADVHVELRFVDNDWRIVGVRPQF